MRNNQHRVMPIKAEEEYGSVECRTLSSKKIKEIESRGVPTYYIR